MNSPEEPGRLRLNARRAIQLDYSLLAVVVGLAIVGLLMILSASAPVAQSELRNSLFFFNRQAMWVVVGVVALLVGANVNLLLVRHLARWGLIVTAFMLLLTQVPGIGVAELGSARWLRIFGVSAQPSELAKLTLTVYLADVLARQEGPWRSAQLRQALAPCLGVVLAVLFQPDLGTTIILAGTAFVLFWCQGVPAWIMALVALVGGTGGLFHSLSNEYQRARWVGFMDPFADPQGLGYQLVQSLYAIGSGGVLGAGWGQSKQKLFYLPIQYADFIFAVLAEEFGLLGTLALVGAFTLVAWRGFAIAAQARDPFHALLAIGLTTAVVSQAFINIGVVTATLPTTGIPLPFLSFGGTSLATTMLMMGLVLNVSRHTQRHLKIVRRVEATP